MTSEQGFSIDDWNAGKEEMRQAIIERARLRGMIPYSDLCDQVRAMTLEPHSNALAAMLGEISADEDAAGRGMLTVIVVLDVWRLVDRAGNKLPLSGKVSAGRGRIITLEPPTMPLNNDGDSILLLNAEGVQGDVFGQAGSVRGVD